MKLTIKVPEPPAGYVYTGEYRSPTTGEHYVAFYTDYGRAAHHSQWSETLPAKYRTLILKPDPVEQERIAFEKWASEHGFILTPMNSKARYYEPSTRAAFGAWLAAKGIDNPLL